MNPIPTKIIEQISVKAAEVINPTSIEVSSFEDDGEVMFAIAIAHSPRYVIPDDGRKNIDLVWLTVTTFYSAEGEHDSMQCGHSFQSTRMKGTDTPSDRYPHQTENDWNEEKAVVYR